MSEFIVETFSVTRSVGGSLHTLSLTRINAEAVCEGEITVASNGVQDTVSFDVSLNAQQIDEVWGILTTDNAVGLDSFPWEKVSEMTRAHMRAISKMKEIGLPAGVALRSVVRMRESVVKELLSSGELDTLLDDLIATGIRVEMAENAHTSTVELWAQARDVLSSERARVALTARGVSLMSQESSVRNHLHLLRLGADVRLFSSPARATLLAKMLSEAELNDASELSGQLTGVLLHYFSKLVLQASEDDLIRSQGLEVGVIDEVVFSNCPSVCWALKSVYGKEYVLEVAEWMHWKELYVQYMGAVGTALLLYGAIEGTALAPEIAAELLDLDADRYLEELGAYNAKRNQ